MKKVTLKEFRFIEELTQQDMAHELGINQSTYSCYERELRDIPVHLMNHLLNFMNTKGYRLKRN